MNISCRLYVNCVSLVPHILNATRSNQYLADRICTYWRLEIFSFCGMYLVLFFFYFFGFVLLQCRQIHFSMISLLSIWYSYTDSVRFFIELYVVFFFVSFVSFLLSRKWADQVKRQSTGFIFALSSFECVRIDMFRFIFNSQISNSRHTRTMRFHVTECADTRFLRFPASEFMGVAIWCQSIMHTNEVTSNFTFEFFFFLFGLVFFFFSSSALQFCLVFCN